MPEDTSLIGWLENPLIEVRDREFCALLGRGMSGSSRIRTVRVAGHVATELEVVACRAPEPVIGVGGSNISAEQPVCPYPGR